MNPTNQATRPSTATPAGNATPAPIAPEQRTAFRLVVACGAAVCLAVSAGGYFLGVSPALAQLSERRDGLDALTARQGRAAGVRADLAVARRRLATAKRDVAALPLRLEPASAINRRLNRLAEVAAAAGVSLNEIQPQPAVDGRHYQTVPIRVVGGGPYPACAAFLHALRTEFPDTAVRSLDAVNPSPARDGNAATLRLDLAWHTTPPAK